MIIFVSREGLRCLITVNLGNASTINPNDIFTVLPSTRKFTLVKSCTRIFPRIENNENVSSSTQWMNRNLLVRVKSHQPKLRKVAVINFSEIKSCPLGKFVIHFWIRRLPLNSFCHCLLPSDLWTSSGYRRIEILLSGSRSTSKGGSGCDPPFPPPRQHNACEQKILYDPYRFMPERKFVHPTFMTVTFPVTLTNVNFWS